MTLNEYFGILPALGEELQQRGVDFRSIEDDELHLTIPGRPSGFDIHVTLVPAWRNSHRSKFDLDGWRHRIASFQDALELIDLGLSHDVPTARNSSSGNPPSARSLADRVGSLGPLRNEVVPAVLLPGLFVMARRAGMLLAVADRRDPIGRNAQIGQVLPRGLGAPLSQRQVVLARAALVAVSLDADPLIRVLLHLIEERLEDGSDLREQLGAVVLEVDADRHQLRRRRGRQHGRRRRWRLGDDLDGRRGRRRSDGCGLRVRAGDERRYGQSHQHESHLDPRRLEKRSLRLMSKAGANGPLGPLLRRRDEFAPSAVSVHAPAVGPLNNLEPWALAIAAWECRTIARKRHRRREASEDTSANPSFDSAEDELVQRDLTPAALEALGQLSESDRETLVATFWDEAASISGATLRKRRERALGRGWSENPSRVARHELEGLALGWHGG